MKKLFALLLLCAALPLSACGGAAPAPETSAFGAHLLGQSREDVLQILGEPDGVLSGFYGDVWDLEDGTSVILYYDADSRVELVKAEANGGGVPSETRAHDRCPGELMTETQELLQLEDGQWYQSYVSSTADIRYIYLNADEAGTDCPWGWYAIGTAADYALANLGTVYDDPSGGMDFTP